MEGQALVVGNSCWDSAWALYRPTRTGKCDDAHRPRARLVTTANGLYHAVAYDDVPLELSRARSYKRRKMGDKERTSSMFPWPYEKNTKEPIHSSPTTRSLDQMSRFSNVDDLLGIAATGRTSPLDFLARAAYPDGPLENKWQVAPVEGREKITVVQGSLGVSIRLHKELESPNMDSKMNTRKCRNRECNNMGGQQGKPRSIYCSKRCQSREQNLRQGRIKLKSGKSSPGSSTPNGASGPFTPATSSPTIGYTPSAGSAFTYRSSPSNSPSSSSSPGASPIVTARAPLMTSPKHEIPSLTESHSMSDSHSSPSLSPSPPPVIPAPSPLPLTSPSPLPYSMSPAPFLMGSSLSMNPHLSHCMSPSPLTLRLGMTPSPLPLSPSPVSGASAFSPIPMSASIGGSMQHVLKPQPGQVPHSPVATSAAVVKEKMEEAGPAKEGENMESLRLAPMRTSS
ncbi:hypothetical protein PROFUN_10158 [Planoprotostelium fungivorum]|uniref:Uncharacterized protein n=1 Tax=Planoprotostelium fungivorum TaxID=1890364 RepID=A0A2P6NEL9_9EUKA|nr:hypothetical protein PROFUN_10158 [Planoprotostelium fungivorum]